MDKSTSSQFSRIDKTTSTPISCREYDIPEQKICLPYFMSSMFATVLEDTVTQLRILAECNNELRITKTRSDMPHHLALKFGIEQPKKTDELEGIDHDRLGCNEYKLNKLDADRKLVTNTLIETYQDLTLDRSFPPLSQHVEQILSEDAHRQSLIEEEAKNKGFRRELSKQIRQQRNHIKTVIYDSDVIINELVTSVEDAQLYAETRTRYVDNWQRARTEQHIQTIHDREIIPSESIETYKQKADHEHRVHSEVETLTNIAINETLEKVEDWMDKYDKDMEKIDLKIQIQKNDYYDALNRRINLEETIEKHDQLMKEWIHFKEEREKARLYHEKMTKSAITVQAWWRGLLVRKQLGPYKVSKKKGKKEKK